jgi:hypothetical protein
MIRLNVTDSGGARVGHFDWDKKAGRWSDGDRNGYGNGSSGTGRGQAIILTSGGKWVMEHWTRWGGEADRFEYITADAAREWLLRNNEDAAVAEHFGPIAEEEDKRTGRPAIGDAINIRLGDDLLAMVDEYARQRSVSRAEAIRRLVTDAVTRAHASSMPVPRGSHPES